jgi:hypothetical protein
MQTREPRRQLLVRARMNAGGGWHDTRILNISSRGLLLQSDAPPVRGTYLEVRRGNHAIVAQVVWTNQERFGVKTRDELPIEALIANIDAPPPRASGTQPIERRKTQRPVLPLQERSRQRGRLIEYGFVAALASAGAAVAAGEVHAVLTAPFQQIALTLGG